MTLTDDAAVEQGFLAEPDRRRVSAGRSIAVVFGALIVAALLNAEPLHRLADQQPFGWRRDVAVAVTGPIESFADTLGLTAPRRWLDDLLDAEEEREGSDTFGAGLVRPPKVLPEDQPSATATTVATPPTTVLARRTPTARRPLQVLFAGDSLIGNLADGFSRMVSDDRRIDVATEVHIATGLARPDVFDWPTYLDRRVRKHHAEVVFLMFGGNDDQPLRGTPGGPPDLFTNEWKREYRRRVGIMMDLAADGRRQVVWIGMPVVERDRLNRARRIMNEVARIEARERSLVTYVEVDDLLAPRGEYTARIKRRSGRIITVREPDGVHVSQAGADVLAPLFWREIADEWHLGKLR